MKQIDFEGTVHQFPDDFSDQEIAAALDSHPAPAPAAEPPSLGGKALQAGLNVVVPVTKKIDAFTGNPIRKGISAMQDEADKPNPSFANLPAAFVQGAAQGFGRNNAPEGKAIFERAGYSGEAAPVSKYAPPPGAYPHMALMGDGVSPAGALGFLLDLATPVPGLGEAKAAGSVTMKMAKATGKGGLEAGGKAAGMAAKAADVLTGTEAATKGLNAAKGTLDAAGKGFEDMGRALEARFGAKLAPDAQKSIQVAVRNGIPPELLPESVLHGPESAASRLARHKAEGPLGQPLRERHHAASLAIQDAIRADIRRIAGETKDATGKVIKEAEIPATAFEAGDLIKTAYDSKVDEMLGGLDVTYKSIIESGAGQAKIPQEAMKKLNSSLAKIEQEATDLGVDALDEVTAKQAEHLLNVVQKVRNRGNNLSSVTRGLQGLGRTAFKVKTPLGQIPPDVKTLRSLYGDLSEAVVSGVESTFGKETADKLLANNKTMTEMFGDKALIPSLGDVGKSEDKLFRSLIMEGDAKRITALKKYLSPEQLQKVKGAALNTLIKENPQGEFAFRTLHNRLTQKTDPLNALFDPGELANAAELIQLGDKLGPAVLSTSGTGGSIAHGFVLGDLIRPGKWVDKVGEGGDKIAAMRQAKKASKAIEDELPKATPGATPPGSMGITAGKTLQQIIHSGPAWKKKGLQLWGAQDEEKRK